MGVFGGTEIPNDGLVLALDAANPRNFDLTKVEVLVVAGGGGGGRYGGGGGAGGVIYNSNFAVTPGTQLTVTIGTGGAGHPGDAQSGGTAANGTNSVFGSLIAIGGGGGGNYNNSGTANLSSGASGGSSGGNGSNGPSALSEQSIKNAPTSGQGNYGGFQSTGYATGGGGGGGAGGSGADGIAGGPGGVGGIGYLLSISGTPTYYAGGGSGTGGLVAVTVASSLGGGGVGLGVGLSSLLIDATPNTGGGGGGGADNNISGTYRAGNGGTGIIIVRYPGPQKAIGGTVTSVGGDTIHTFTTSGNFTPLVNTNASAVLGLSDLSGNRNFGDSGGSGVLYSSANGGSLSFDGSNDKIVTPMNSSFVYGTSPFAIDAWIYVTGYTGQYSTGAIWSQTVDGRNYFYMTVYSPGGIGFGFGDGGGSSVNTSTSVVQLNTWMHVCFTRVGTGSNQFFIYVNGVQQAVSTVSYDFNNTTYIPTIGQYTHSYQLPFLGRISNLKVYKGKGLTAAEVSQNYNALRRRFEGKVFYYEGNDARNFVSNWNDQEIFNMTTTADLGNCYIHGWGGSPRSYTLSLTNLPTHTEVRYECYIHMVDSLDNETSEIYTRNSAGTESLAVRWTKQYNQVPNVSTLATGMVFPFKTGQTYSYRPWGNGAYGYDGYASFNTGFYAHTGSNFSIRHYFGADQGSNDEAYYISHVKLTIGYL